MIKNLRWYIAILLMLATTVNYLDRQTLSVAVASPKLHMSDDDYSLVTSSFLLAYAIMHPIAGRIIDWLGTRWGYMLAVTWWSLANIGHAFARGVYSFAALRFLLGVGEAGNFPSAIKSIGEWFPPKERAFATGIMNVGAGTGAVIAPPVVAWIILKFGWQEAFVFTGSVGFLWVLAWYFLYDHPERHKRLTPSERDLIQTAQNDQLHLTEPDPSLEMSDRDRATRARATAIMIGTAALTPPLLAWVIWQYGWKEILLPTSGMALIGVVAWSWRVQIDRKGLWALMAARFCSDPVWFFYLFWLPKYLNTERGFDLVKIGLFAWVPYLASDVGSLLGGGLSSYLARRGFSVIAARKIALCACAVLMPVAIPAVLAKSPYVALFFISIATFGHQAWAASILTLPADIFPRRMVASAYGCAGMCGMFGGALFTRLVGKMLSSWGYVPLFTIVGFLHIIGTTVVVIVVRSRATAVSAVGTAHRAVARQV